jgi:hypothetical protein
MRKTAFTSSKFKEKFQEFEDMIETEKIRSMANPSPDPTFETYRKL